jgi:hypothetical protein
MTGEAHLSEQNIGYSESGSTVAEARRRKKGKGPIVGHGAKQRQLANQLGAHAPSQTGSDRFMSRYGDFGRKN